MSPWVDRLGVELVAASSQREEVLRTAKPEAAASGAPGDVFESVPIRDFGKGAGGRSAVQPNLRRKAPARGRMTEG